MGSSELDNRVSQWRAKYAFYRRLQFWTLAFACFLWIGWAYYNHNWGPFDFNYVKPAPVTGSIDDISNRLRTYVRCSGRCQPVMQSTYSSRYRFAANVADNHKYYHVLVRDGVALPVVTTRYDDTNGWQGQEIAITGILRVVDGRVWPELQQWAANQNLRLRGYEVEVGLRPAIRPAYFLAGVGLFCLLLGFWLGRPSRVLLQHVTRLAKLSRRPEISNGLAIALIGGSAAFFFLGDLVHMLFCLLLVIAGIFGAMVGQYSFVAILEESPAAVEPGASAQETGQPRGGYLVWQCLRERCCLALPDILWIYKETRLDGISTKLILGVAPGVKRWVELANGQESEGLYNELVERCQGAAVGFKPYYDLCWANGGKDWDRVAAKSREQL